MAAENPSLGVLQRIQEVLAEHSRRIDPNHPGYPNCRCGFVVDMPQDHSQHVAPLVLALFTEEWCDDIGGPQWARYQRFVSDPVVHHGPRYFMSAVEDTE